MTTPQCEDPPLIGRRMASELLLMPVSRPAGVVVCADGGLDGCGRGLAEVLRGHRLATLALAAESAPAGRDGPLRGRLHEALAWLGMHPGLAGLPLGLFGAGAAAAAALRVALDHPGRVAALVCCGGRPGLAAAQLAGVQAPTLLIVGGHDAELLALNHGAMPGLRCKKRLEIVPAATRHFEEPGALDAAVQLAGAWFATHLSSGRGR